MTPTAHLLTLVIAACAIGAGCGGDTGGPGSEADTNGGRGAVEQPKRGGRPELARIGNFEAPVHVAEPPAGRRLVFVVEQPGTIRIMREGRTLERPFLDLRNRVRYGGEQGLLSIAFDPRYSRNRRFYVYYVTEGGDLRIDALRRKRGSATRAAEGSRRKVIEIAHPQFENHNGGQLQFGPDGFLYAGTGDGGSAGDPDGNAQNPSVLLGKLLRIDPKPGGGYRIPRRNPFAGTAGGDEIYAFGLRNPYRFSFDRRTNHLWIGDVGQNVVEEIDRVGHRRARGANFGWDLFEGSRVFDGDGTEPDNYVPPVHEYFLDRGNCSVIGGHVVRDDRLGRLNGRYLYADFCGGEIRSLDAGAKDPGATDAPTGLTLDSPSSFGEGRDGRIYVTSLSGPVYRIR